MTVSDTGRRRGVLLAGGVAVPPIMMMVMVVPYHGPTMVSVGAVAQFTAAVVAAAASALTAARVLGRRRLAWCSLAAGCGGWALASGYWTATALVADRPAKSIALFVVGYLLLSLSAATGVLLHPGSGPLRAGARLGLFLDPAVMTLAFLLAWLLPGVRRWHLPEDAGATLLPAAFPVADGLLSAVTLPLRGMCRWG